MNEQRNYVRFEIANRRKLMSQTQRKLEKLKIFEKKFRIKVSVMIVQKIHNFEEMIVDEQSGDFLFLSVIDFFIDLNFFDSLLVALMNGFFLSFDLNFFDDNRSKKLDNA